MDEKEIKGVIETENGKLINVIYQIVSNINGIAYYTYNLLGVLQELRDIEKERLDEEKEISNALYEINKDLEGLIEEFKTFKKY